MDSAAIPQANFEAEPLLTVTRPVFSIWRSRPSPAVPPSWSPAVSSWPPPPPETIAP